ncbi:MAG: sulfatase [Planctomycetota bacterium]|nr:MAG: sulfatase [Planctomycetota bacterium]
MPLQLTWQAIVRFIIVLIAPLVLPYSTTADQAAGNLPKPNFIIILIDDLGWADVGCYGSTFYETPNIDTMAAEGMKFTDGYAACPVCSPTRAAILTGKYPARLKLTEFLYGQRIERSSPILPAKYKQYLGREEVTIAEVLKSAGYATAHIGKWHLGREQFYPEHQGFDVNIGGTHYGYTRSFFWPGWRGYVSVEGRHEGEYLPERLSEEAVRFIESNKDKPFFLHLSHYLVHIPMEAKKEMIAKYQTKLNSTKGCQNNPIYAAMIESMDLSVGRVMEALKRLEIDDRTVVFFTSDNGGLAWKDRANTPATCNAPLRGGKQQLYEGGIRVPWIVKWSGVIEAGSACNVPVISTDYFPTILEIIGIKNSKTNGPIDGVSNLPLLKQSGKLKRDAIFWHYPHFCLQGVRPGGIIRQGDYKLIERYEDGTLELYDLKHDISETRNLAFEMSARTRQLRQLLHQWRESVKANMPLPNPHYHQPEK